MKTIGYVDKAIRVPNTSIFLKASENIVMDIYNARIPDDVALFDIYYQNTTTDEKLYIKWKSETEMYYWIELVCEYTRSKKVLNTRIVTGLWSGTADTACDKEASVYGEHYEGQPDVVKALGTMPDKFDKLLRGVNQIIHGYMMKCSNDNTDFILEYNDFAAEFESTLKKHGFTMNCEPCCNNSLGGYYVRIYDGDNYDDSDNSFMLDTETMEIGYTDGIFEDVMKKLDNFTVNDIAGLFECAKIIFDTAIKYRDIQATLERRLKPRVKFVQ